MTVTVGASGRAGAARRRTLLSFHNASALYIFAVMFALFALWVPDTFLAWNTWRSMFDFQALNALAAIAVVIPLAAGVFNIAIGAEIGIASVIVAWFLAEQGYGVFTSTLLTLIVGVMIGLVSGLLIVGARIESIIATLGVSSILGALTEWVSGGEQIVNLGAAFRKLASAHFLGLTLTTWIMLGVAVVVWYVLEWTPVGRRVYATGGNIEAARLAGVRTSWVTVSALMAGGLIAALTGVLQSSRLATGDPTIGPGYLLPAFAAAMLGSTQLRPGRHNVWGTVIAVYVIATGIKGLQLAGAPVWIPELFNGAALLLAVGIAMRQQAGLRGILNRLRRRATPAGQNHPDPNAEGART